MKSKGMGLFSRKLSTTGVLVYLMLTACGAPSHIIEKSSELEAADGIVGGITVDANDTITKSIVGIYDTKIKALCTGSLLENNMVLTAAHCVASTPQNLVIIFGTDLRKAIQVLAVDAGRVHPNWVTHQDDEFNTADIALLHFKGTIPSGYAPAKMLANVSLLRNNQIVTVAGYGITESKTGSGNLRKVNTKIADTKFSETEVKIDQTQGRGVCHGDSGGPAYVTIKGQRFLFGITSRGIDDEQDTCLKYSAFTNALAYKEWMTSATNTILESVK